MGEGDYLSRGAAEQRTADSGGCGVDAGAGSQLGGLVQAPGKQWWGIRFWDFLGCANLEKEKGGLRVVQIRSVT